MSFPRKATDQQIADAYAKAGSCKGAADILGIGPQSVHERLCRLGINKPANVFSDAERARISSEYQDHADGGTLAKLAESMGRPKQSICRVAGGMGLTNQSRGKSYLSDSLSASAKRRIVENGHPRGMAGKTHTAETKARIAEASAARWAAMSANERADFTLAQMKAKAAQGGLVTARPETTWKAGWRVVGDRRVYFRSQWEANYGRYLEWLRATGHVAAWEHEPEVFWFEKIKRGCRSYLPDFKVTENDGRVIFHEVKGWMDDRSKTKIKRMRIYHPKVALLVIDGKAYAEIRRKVSALVPGWEE